jgi:hypothetical protein
MPDGLSKPIRYDPLRPEVGPMWEITFAPILQILNNICKFNPFYSNSHEDWQNDNVSPISFYNHFHQHFMQAYQ